MVQDKVHFGSNYHATEDSFNFTFGCVSKETKLFYKQAADGILGMGMGSKLGSVGQRPIYQAMFEAAIIEKNMFNICLG